MAWDLSPNLLTDEEIEEIRRAVREGLKSPPLASWVERLLADRDERVRQRTAKSPTGE